MVQRQRRNESGETLRIRANEIGHRVVGQPGQIDRGLPIRVDRLDWGRGERKDLTIVGTELLEHPEAYVHIVQERDIEPALDGPRVDGDLLQPFEERLREDVIEDIDLHANSFNGR
jgi:hypothetical protein